MLTPQEVTGHVFEKALFGGYEIASVDKFLDQLTEDYTALYKESGILKTKMKVLVDKAMCAGAILNARLKWVCYGARDDKTGSLGSVLNLFEENYGYRPALYGGILEAECTARMQDFFRDLRG